MDYWWTLKLIKQAVIKPDRNLHLSALNLLSAVEGAFPDFQGFPLYWTKAQLRKCCNFDLIVFANRLGIMVGFSPVFIRVPLTYNEFLLLRGGNM